MSSFKIIERSDDLKSLEKGVKNKWVWKWTEDKDENGDFVSEYCRKIKEAGCACCIWCNKKITYGSSGKKAILNHAKKDNHRSSRAARMNNQTLPASFTFTGDAGRYEKIVNKDYYNFSLQAC